MPQTIERIFCEEAGDVRVVCLHLALREWGERRQEGQKALKNVVNTAVAQVEQEG